MAAFPAVLTVKNFCRQTKRRTKPRRDLPTKRAAAVDKARKARASRKRIWSRNALYCCRFRQGARWPRKLWRVICFNRPPCCGLGKRLRLNVSSAVERRSTALGEGQSFYAPPLFSHVQASIKLRFGSTTKTRAVHPGRSRLREQNLRATSLLMASRQCSPLFFREATAFSIEPFLQLPLSCRFLTS